jgi:hypothetical protein
MKSKIPFDPSPGLPGHKQQFRRFHRFYQKDECRRDFPCIFGKAAALAVALSPAKLS